MTPWTMWARAWDNGVAAAQTGFRFAEMMQASQEVVASRCDTIAAAARDPLRGDYRELGRMVPEKVAAFGSAASSAMEDMRAVQADAIGTMQALAALTLAGRVPSARDVAHLGACTARMAERTMGAYGRALAPVHRAAMGNAKRLRRR